MLFEAATSERLRKFLANTRVGDWVMNSLKQALDLSLFWEYRAILLQGLVVNALVFLCAALLALSAGLGAALLRVNRFFPNRLIGTLHVELFRNAPDYIMLVWVHFVLPLLLGIMIKRRVEFHPFVSAVIALGLVYSGYFAETFRAGIEAIPRWNLDAARGFGMSERLILWRIMLPQVVRRMRCPRRSISSSRCSRQRPSCR
jgi:polar amino acid transport system permease protein